MKRILFISVILITLCGCQSKDKKNSSKTERKDTTKKTKQVTSTIAKQDQIAEKLIGIWFLKNSTGNASFELKKSTIYYPDPMTEYPYKVVGDSIIVKYDDYVQHIAFRFKGVDTLILVSEDGPNTFYRVKY